MRIVALFVLTMLLAVAQQQQNLPPNLTLAQALQIALNNSTIIRTALAQLEQASGGYEQAHSALLPQLNFVGHQGIQTVSLQGIGIDVPGVAEKVGPFGSMDARLVLTQNILNLANLRASQSYRASQRSSQLLTTNAREVVALNVIAAYLQALKAKATRDTLSAQTKLAEELYNLTRDRVKQGVSAELDANRAMQQVNTLRQQWQEAEQSYIAAKLTLANVLSTQITSDFDVSDVAAYGTGGPPARDESLTTALASRQDYLAGESKVSAAELKVRAAKAERLPAVGLLVSDGQSGSTPVHNVNTYNVQGVVTVPIYTGGRIRGEIETAEGELKEAKAALDQNRAQIETDVLTAISGVEWAQKALETSQGNVNLSRGEVDLTRQRFTQGITDNTEVVNAQVRLESADDANIRAQYTLGLARANLARAVGAAEKTYRK